MIILRVNGEPSTITAQQKGVNWKKRAFYTKAAVKAEARRITRNLHRWDEASKTWVRVKAIAAPLLGPVHCSIKIRYPMTQEQTRKHADQLSNSSFELRHGKRPDFDNTIKLLLDTLTKLKFWEDDGQISDCNVHKRYGVDPCIQIAIKPVGEIIVP